MRIKIYVLSTLLVLSLAGCGLLTEWGVSDPQMTPLPTFSPLTPTLVSPNTPSLTTAHPDRTAAASPEPPLGSATLSPVASPEPAIERAVALPDPTGYKWDLTVDGLNAPVGLENAKDSSGRLFAIEQPGLIRIIHNGSLLPVPFLDIRSRIGSSGSEQGLLGLAFHPQYTENGYFFVNYTDLQGDTVIARYRVSADPFLADPTTELRLLEIQQPFPNHNGGGMAFGPDGYLYISLGDGGSGGDPRNNGQSVDTLLGKLLRIDVGEAEGYSIPTNNPFVGGDGRPEIWAYGLRNPWRFSFDKLTGDLYIADVGQNSWEEVNFQPAGSLGGENYGWNLMEGFHCYQSPACDQSGLTIPVVEYALHVQGDCAVTGGYVYRGSNLPAWQGIYIYGDYCSGRVWGLFQTPDGVWESGLLFETGARITTFGQDEGGEIYLVDHSGSVYQLVEK